MQEQRRDERFDDIGRVDAQSLCPLSGVLQDISMAGCRIKFPVQCTVDMESEVELTVTPAHKQASQPFILIGQPTWVKEEADSCEIGFKLLHSPGSRQLGEYIQKLALAAAEYDEEEEMLNICSSL